MSKKVSLIIFGLLITALVFSTAVAAGTLIPASEKAQEKAKVENSAAIENTEHGWALNPPGLEKITFIHYKEGFVKPPWAGGGKDKEQDAKCYDFLGKGVLWKELPQDYVIDPDNSGMSKSFVVSAITKATEEWDKNTSAELFGTYTVEYDADWDDDAPDGRNELVFENYPKAGVIAVTNVWGYFSGPPSIRKIVEFDVMFDTDYTWGDATVNEALMDLQNIATHEIGHGVGLDDLYEDTCQEETMYGYSSEGEIKKRSLNDDDITGLQELYGI